jgi:hypothetical protein
VKVQFALAELLWPVYIALERCAILSRMNIVVNVPSFLNRRFCVPAYIQTDGYYTYWCHLAGNVDKCVLSANLYSIMPSL